MLSKAHASVTAFIRAHGTFAADAVVVVKALALARLAVADALVGALNLRVGLVSSGGDSDPSSSPGKRHGGELDQGGGFEKPHGDLT